MAYGESGKRDAVSRHAVKASASRPAWKSAQPRLRSAAGELGAPSAIAFTAARLPGPVHSANASPSRASGEL